MLFEGNHHDDIAFKIPEGPVCTYDVEDEVMKSPEAIFKGGVEFFAATVAVGARDLAARLTRKNMSGLPYWQARPFAELGGTMATDEEFAACMAKL